MVEVLPNPRVERTRATPRERARRRLVQLTNAAATAGIGLSVSYCVVDMIPPPAPCNETGLVPSAELTITATWLDVDVKKDVATCALEGVLPDGYQLIDLEVEGGELISGTYPWEIFVLAERTVVDVRFRIESCGSEQVVVLRFDVSSRKKGEAVPYETVE